MHDVARHWRLVFPRHRTTPSFHVAHPAHRPDPRQRGRGSACHQDPVRPPRRTRHRLVRTGTALHRRDAPTPRQRAGKGNALPGGRDHR
ncbi:hypothetical protein G6F57_023716 [Rhizopus arrhizus]|nr:hypothetical protein G6F57_023716 [Rhizopus arrhizus]